MPRELYCDAFKALTSKSVSSTFWSGGVVKHSLLGGHDPNITPCSQTVFSLRGGGGAGQVLKNDVV